MEFKRNGAICQNFVYYSEVGVLQNRNESGNGGITQFSFMFGVLLKLNGCAHRTEENGHMFRKLFGITNSK